MGSYLVSGIGMPSRSSHIIGVIWVLSLPSLSDRRWCILIEGRVNDLPALRASVRGDLGVQGEKLCRAGKAAWHLRSMWNPSIRCTSSDSITLEARRSDLRDVRLVRHFGLTYQTTRALRNATCRAELWWQSLVSVWEDVSPSCKFALDQLQSWTFPIIWHQTQSYILQHYAARQRSAGSRQVFVHSTVSSQFRCHNVTRRMERLLISLATGIPPQCVSWPSVAGESI